jgi:hypothetical protein
MSNERLGFTVPAASLFGESRHRVAWKPAVGFRRPIRRTSAGSQRRHENRLRDRHGLSAILSKEWGPFLPCTPRCVYQPAARSMVLATQGPRS